MENIKVAVLVYLAILLVNKIALWAIHMQMVEKVEVGQILIQLSYENASPPARTMLCCCRQRLSDSDNRRIDPPEFGKLRLNCHAAPFFWPSKYMNFGPSLLPLIVSERRRRRKFSASFCAR